ncbi:MFS transporter [Bacillus mesophilum]|uniref:MFS transporter n=1 Tax=Bacillus mesophilum TaxID=1071718 RepID=A0A7V7RPF4_9BACI|nr:MFS transporter [Bacillus mesophilum]KAB2335153.1 MFS transporter [Bacillus mesophilum]
MKKKNNQFALLALAISAFAIGTTEFISVGLLPLIAEDLNISLPIAGLTVSIYALGVTIGAPILTSITAAIPRKTLLIWIMIIFIIGNIIAATAANIGILLIARLISAFSHGVFMSIGSTIAASLVSHDKRAGAISIMFTGLTVATVTGVPFGTFLGQQFGWRLAFIAIVVIGIISLISNYFLIPGNMPRGKAIKLTEQFKLFKQKQLLQLFLITALGYGGTFVVFTFLSPLLQNVTGFKENTVALLLLVYGVAIAIGNMTGGKLANKDPLKALFFMFIIQAAILFILPFSAPYKIAGLMSIMFMGLFAFMNVPGLQSYVVVLAERYVPSAVDVASAVNIAAFNAGIAIGSYAGGLISDHMGLIHTGWVGGIMVLAAALLTGSSLKAEKAYHSKVS